MPSASSAAALGLGGMFVATQFASTAFTSPATQVPQLRGSSTTSTQSSSSTLRAGLACSGVVVAAAAAGAGKSMRSVRVARAATRECPKVLAGTGGPLPESFWDPAGLTNNKSDEELLFYRAAELKHGRIAMMAVFGWFTNASGNHYLGDLWLKKPASDNPLEAFSQLSLLGIFQIVFFISVLEWLTTVPCPPPKEAPWDVIGMTDVLEEDTDDNPMAEYKKIQMQELNNGRLAMVAIIGLITQTLMTGDYGGKLDIVNPVFTNWDAAVPEVPFKPPTIYPGQVWPQFTLKWPTLAQNFLYN